MKKVYVVDLTKEEKAELLELVRKGEARVRKMNRAHILLLADECRTDKDIAQALHTSPSTVERTRRRFVEGGFWSTPSTSRRVLGAGASSMGIRKRTLWLWPAPILQRAKSVGGVCRCSLRGSWSSKWSMRSPMRR